MRLGIAVPLAALALILVAFPVRAASPDAPLCPVPCRIPILMYHHIQDPREAEDPLGKRLSVSPSKFSLQLDALKKSGFVAIRFQDLASGSALPPKPVILTFDDGYDDAALHALPALKTHRMVGTFFIISGDIGKQHFMTREQLRALVSAGMEIGAHTVSHADLSKAPFVRALHEIVDSAASLRTEYHTPVIAFAYPFGKYRSVTPAVVRLSKMHFAVTTRNGIASDRSAPLLLPRLRVMDRQSGAALAKRLNALLSFHHP